VTFALFYPVQALLLRIQEFLYHWYADGSRWFLNFYLSCLRALDRSFAVRINLVHFFEPLYRDYSPVGRIIGPILRLFRVLAGSIVYLAISAIFAVLYIAWDLVLPSIIFYGIKGYF
jgi:hypothetical protein